MANILEIDTTSNTLNKMLSSMKVYRGDDKQKIIDTCNHNIKIIEEIYDKQEKYDRTDDVEVITWYTIDVPTDLKEIKIGDFIDIHNENT